MRRNFKAKKINFINLFGYEVRKKFSKVLYGVKLKKSEENKFLEIYLCILEKKWKKNEKKMKK